MAIDPALLRRFLPFLPPELTDQFAQSGESIQVDKDTVLLRQGQYLDIGKQLLAYQVTQVTRSGTVSHLSLHHRYTFLTAKYSNMKKNMGNTDRAIRVLIAVLVAVLYFTNVISGTLGLVLMILAGVFVLTSLISFCPIYTILGINTCAVKK